MIRALVTGKLLKPAESRVSNLGKGYAVGTLTLDSAADHGPRFVKLVAFGESAERLTALAKGAPLAASGKLEVSTWVPESGTAEASLRMLVDDLATIPGPTGARAAE